MQCEQSVYRPRTKKALKSETNQIEVLCPVGFEIRGYLVIGLPPHDRGNWPQLRKDLRRATQLSFDASSFL